MAEEKPGFEGTKPWPTTSVHGNSILEGTPMASTERVAPALDDPGAAGAQVRFDRDAISTALPVEQPKTQIPAMDGSGAVMEVGPNQPVAPEPVAEEAAPADSQAGDLPPQRVGFLKGMANKLKEMAGIG